MRKFNWGDATILTSALERRPTRTPKLALVVQFPFSDLGAAAEMAGVSHESNCVVVPQSVRGGKEKIKNEILLLSSISLTDLRGQCSNVAYRTGRWCEMTYPVSFPRMEATRASYWASQGWGRYRHITTSATHKPATTPFRILREAKAALVDVALDVVVITEGKGTLLNSMFLEDFEDAIVRKAITCSSHSSCVRIQWKEQIPQDLLLYK